MNDIRWLWGRYWLASEKEKCCAERDPSITKYYLQFLRNTSGLGSGWHRWERRKREPRAVLLVCSLLVVYLYKRTKRVQYCLRIQCVNLEEANVLLLSQFCSKDGVQHPTNSIMKAQVQTDCERSLGVGEGRGRMLVFCQNTFSSDLKKQTPYNTKFVLLISNEVERNLYSCILGLNFGQIPLKKWRLKSNQDVLISKCHFFSYWENLLFHQDHEKNVRGSFSVQIPFSHGFLQPQPLWYMFWLSFLGTAAL